LTFNVRVIAPKSNLNLIINNSESARTEACVWTL